eukprot:130556-Rhodomonas_salina.2
MGGEGGREGEGEGEGRGIYGVRQYRTFRIERAGDTAYVSTGLCVSSAQEDRGTYEGEAMLVEELDLPYASSVPHVPRDAKYRTYQRR